MKIKHVLEKSRRSGGELVRCALTFSGNSNNNRPSLTSFQGVYNVLYCISGTAPFSLCEPPRSYCGNLTEPRVVFNMTHGVMVVRMIPVKGKGSIMLDDGVFETKMKKKGKI